MDYDQPSFYKFSQDSIKLANTSVAKAPAANNCLDLGSGCGVVGIEVANKNHKINELILLELQREFLPSLEINTNKMLRRDVHYEIIISSFDNFNSDKKFDLITANLPYFLYGKSRPSLSKNKDLCRRWNEKSILSVLRILNNNLDKDGVALLLLDKSLIKYFEGFSTQIVKNLKNVVMIAASKEK